MDNIKVSRVESVLLQRGSECHRGSLHLTQHHLIFKRYDTPSSSTPSSSSSSTPNSQEDWIPYALLSLVTRQPSLLPLGSQGRRGAAAAAAASTSAAATSSSSPSSSGSPSTSTLPAPMTARRIYPLQLRFRTFDAASLGFESEAKATEVFDTLRSLAVMPTIEQVYAFYYTPQPAFTYSDGWSVYDFKAEFTRQGVGTRTRAWRFTDLNTQYEFCPTYPALLVAPTRISDTTLQHAAKYRSKGRIPALTYLHWANNGTITRCAQPLPGLKQTRSVQDEKVVEAIFSSHHYADPATAASSDLGAVYGATTTNLIVDARPTTNAVATYARGGGTENMDHYKGCRKVFSGIENIHVMRDSINRVVEALRAADEPTTFGMEVGVEGGEADVAVAADPTPPTAPSAAPVRQPLDLAALRRSNWLKHVAMLLDGTLAITRNIHIASSHVMVHCSDGWDRTSQLASLAEICLDPYFRTKRGFAVLVEKDWLSFGHRFADRCGHGGSEKHYVTAAGHGESSDEEESDEGTTAAAAESGAQAAANAFWGFTKQLTSNFGGGGGGGGHGGGAHLKETSPVFTQFLDAVWQMMRQFPARFEFNEHWLVTLHRELHECRFGTFLANSERERKLPIEASSGLKPRQPIVQSTESVWNYLLSEEHGAEFANPAFDPTLDDAKSKRADADMGVLLVKSTDVRWWAGLFGERVEEANRALDFEESERKRRKAEKQRWDEEREQRDRERREAEEERRRQQRQQLQQQRQQQQQQHLAGVDAGAGDSPAAWGGSVRSVSSSSAASTKGAVDLMTASQLQSGNGEIDTSKLKLGYQARTKPPAAALRRVPSATGTGTSPQPALASPSLLPRSQSTMEPWASPQARAAAAQPSTDAAARFKSWAIGGWDRIQEAVSGGSGAGSGGGYGLDAGVDDNPWAQPQPQTQSQPQTQTRSGVPPSSSASASASANPWRVASQGAVEGTSSSPATHYASTSTPTSTSPRPPPKPRQSTTHAHAHAHVNGLANTLEGDVENEDRYAHHPRYAASPRAPPAPAPSANGSVLDSRFREGLSLGGDSDGGEAQKTAPTGASNGGFDPLGVGGV